MDHDLLTEFGWRVIRWTNGGQDTDEGHWIVKERMQLRNGKYVPDNREVILSKSASLTISEYNPSIIASARLNLCRKQCFKREFVIWFVRR